jgi:hypothetical protein
VNPKEDLHNLYRDLAHCNKITISDGSSNINFRLC